MTDKELILQIINEISDEIILKKENISKELDMGLFAGTAGISLFMFHMYEFSKEKKHKDTALYYLEKSFEKINSNEDLPTFCSGIAGVAWIINYLVDHSFIEQDNLEVLDEFDDYLYNSMKSFAVNKNFDFLHGATGVALYFTGRVNQNPKASIY